MSANQLNPERAMAEGKRPGGLTALAVFNFIFGGLGALAVLAVLALIGAAGAAGAKLGDAAAAPGAGVLYLSLFLGLIAVILMICSGVGYIKQKRFLGRTLGNAYAVTSLINTVVGIVAIKSGFGIGTIIGLIYPLLTLFLLNTTFKDDLAN
jgi:hypothetical protein